MDHPHDHQPTRSPLQNKKKDNRKALQNKKKDNRKALACANSEGDVWEIAPTLVSKGNDVALPHAQSTHASARVMMCVSSSFGGDCRAADISSDILRTCYHTLVAISNRTDGEQLFAAELATRATQGRAASLAQSKHSSPHAANHALAKICRTPLHQTPLHLKHPALRVATATHGTCEKSWTACRNHCSSC